MTNAPRILEPQCEWTSDQVADESLWTEVFSDAELAELDGRAPARTGEVRGRARDRSRRLPAADAARRLAQDRGASSSTDAVSSACAGSTATATPRPRWRCSTGASACTSARPWPQNKHGHVLGDVTDQDKALDDPTARGNELGGVALPFHCDGSDLVGLMCLENGLPWRTVGRRQLGDDPQPPRARESRARGGALRSPSPTTSAANNAPGSQAVLRLARVHRVGRAPVRALHPALHPAPHSAIRRHRDSPRQREARSRAWWRTGRRPGQPRAHGAAARATCSSSTTTTCCTGARPTRTTAPPAGFAISSGSGWRRTS